MPIATSVARRGGLSPLLRARPSAVRRSCAAAAAGFRADATRCRADAHRARHRQRGRRSCRRRDHAAPFRQACTRSPATAASSGSPGCRRARCVFNVRRLGFEPATLHRGAQAGQDASRDVHAHGERAGAARRSRWPTRAIKTHWLDPVRRASQELVAARSSRARTSSARARATGPTSCAHVPGIRLVPAAAASATRS